MAYTTINKGESYFNTILYTGNASTSHAITGVGFQPDWVWLKNRGSSDGHHLYDVARGVTKRIRSDSANAESTQSDGLTAFGTDGFTVSNSSGVNSNSANHVSWNWKAGDSNTSVSSSGSGNGAINACTHRANTTAGFSIVKYTGLNSEISNLQHTKVTHGLGVKPDFLMIKNRDSSNNWVVTRGIDNDNHGVLSSTNAFSGSLFTGNQNSSDSTHFVVGNEAAVNANGDEFIAYVFAEKQGFSKFGNYTGNGSTDGTFVHTGFKPAWVMIKRSSGTGNWLLFDNKRDTDNLVSKLIFPNDSSAEQDLTAQTPLDFISNGFKLRNSNLTGDTNINISGSTYIYMAFAKSPYVSSTGVPTNAR